MTQIDTLIQNKRAAIAGEIAAQKAANDAAAQATEAANLAYRLRLCELTYKAAGSTLTAPEVTEFTLMLLRGNVDDIERIGKAMERLIFCRANPSEQNDHEKRQLLFTPASVLRLAGFVKADGSESLVHE